MLSSSTAATGCRFNHYGKRCRSVPVLVCHDEIVVECDAERAADAKTWLEKAMIEGMDTVLNSTDEVHVPVEVEARIGRSWGEGC